MRSAATPTQRAGKIAVAAQAFERKPKGRGHERREEILAAAARMFLERGVDDVSTRRIAEAVGISQSALYVYFPNKDAILLDLCDQCFRRLVGLFSSPEVAAGDPVEGLRRMMRAYVRFGIEHHDEYRLGFMTKDLLPPIPPEQLSAFLLDPANPRDGMPAGLQCFALLQDRVNQLALHGRLRQDPRLVAQVAWATGHGLVTLLITKPEFPWIERETLIEGSLDILFGGLLVEDPGLPEV